MVNKILRARPAHRGQLSNTFCSLVENGKCQVGGVTTYDLNDPEIRELLNSLDFICNVADRRFKICLDKPGLCRKWQVEKCGPLSFIFGCKVTSEGEQYIPASNWELITGAATICFNKYRYPFKL